MAKLPPLLSDAAGAALLSADDPAKSADGGAPASTTPPAAAVGEDTGAQAQVRTPKAAADYPDHALRFADNTAFVLREGHVVIENRSSGATRTFAREEIPILDLFMNWAGPHDLIRWAMDTGGTREAIERAVGVLRDLLTADDLISRREDLTGARLPPPGPGWSDALRFLQATRTDRHTSFAPPAEFNAALAEKAFLTRQASAFFEYANAPFGALSPPRREATDHDRGFVETMLARRTARRFANRPLSEPDLSTLLYFGWGMVRSVSNPLGDVFVRKTSPSGGSLHPVEAYPVVLNVEGVAQGCYHYSVRRHGLEQLWTGDAREWIAFACGDQRWIAEAAVVILCTGFLPRTAWKYDFSRVARAVMSEIGFSGQSALMTAAWLGLGGFTTLALRDEVFEDRLGLDPTRQPVFSVVGMGHLEPELSDWSRPRDEPTGEVEGG